MKQITKKNNSDSLKKWSASYWTAQARPENRSLNLRGTIDPLKIPEKIVNK